MSQEYLAIKSTYFSKEGMAELNFVYVHQQTGEDTMLLCSVLIVTRS